MLQIDKLFQITIELLELLDQVIRFSCLKAESRIYKVAALHGKLDGEAMELAKGGMRWA
jgi:hypothetical protein